MSIVGARVILYVKCECLVQYLAVGCRSTVVAGILVVPATKCTRVVRSDEVNIRNERRRLGCVYVLACLHSVRVRALPPTSSTHQCIMYKCTKSKAFHQTFSSSSSLKHSSRSSDVQTITLFCRPSPSRRPQPAFTRIFVYLHSPAFSYFYLPKKRGKKKRENVMRILPLLPQHVTLHVYTLCVCVCVLYSH